MDPTTPQPAPNAKKIALACWAGIAVVMGILVFSAARRIPDNMADFFAFYNGAALMRDGGNPYTATQRSYLYPPLLAFMLRPLTSLSMGQAGAVALCVNIAAATLGLWLLARTAVERLAPPASLARASVATLLILVTVVDKMRAELRMWQTNSLLLLSLAIAVRYVDRRPIVAGIALGFATNIKYLPILLLPYLLFRRRWTVCAAFVASIAFFAFLPATVNGWDANVSHLKSSMSGILSLVGVLPERTGADVEPMAALFSISITSAMGRVFDADHGKALLAAAVIGLAAGGLCVLAYVTTRTRLIQWPSAAGQRAQPYAALIMIEIAALWGAILALSPQLNPRHLVMLALTVAPLAAIVLKPGRSWTRWAAGAVLALVWMAMVFPPGGATWAQGALGWWREVGGVGWVALCSAVATVWIGTRALARGEP